MRQLIAAIDQGTTSTRCILFDHHTPVATGQREHTQLFPQPGWVEHNPLEIWQRTQQVIAEALKSASAAPKEISAIGITNQRETTVVWEKSTGRPLCNAIVWQDTRTKEICDLLAQENGPDCFRDITGLPLATYFSGPKIQWILHHIPGARKLAESGEALFGTIDTWLTWWLSGGPAGGAHITDPTNASRTLLMNLATLDWDESLLRAFSIPRPMLPRIVPSGGIAATTRNDGPFAAEIPIAGILGDQQAALVGQACFQPGESKNTYGTGCFMLLNTGPAPVASRCGLLTTVAYQWAGQKPIYALEGSIAVTGALVQWLRDNLGIIQSSSEIEPLASSVPDNGGIYIVPAFSGLFAPYWRSDARGIIAGLTRHTDRRHLARAVLEATAYQTRDVLEAMRQDSGVQLACLKVDGGMSVNHLLMQFQADILNLPVVRCRVAETTALGAACAAGLATGYWPNEAALRSSWQEDQTWRPAMPKETRDSLYAAWGKAVDRSLNWV